MIMDFFIKTIEGKVFEIKAYESYNKEEVEHLSKAPDCDNTIVKGLYKVDSVKVLENHYRAEATSLSGTEVKALFAKIQEIENTECETTILEYYA